MAYKVCFYFDKDGKYSGKGQIPSIKGAYPLPSTATWVEPEVKENFFPVWDGSVWSYEPYPYDPEDATVELINEQGDD